MIRKGSNVSWKWGNGQAEGKVKETSTNTITKTIQGKEVTRHGKKGEKALVIEQEDGTKVLKLESEVEKA